VIASEDVGCAYPLAAAITYSCTEGAKEVGLPEAAILLANATVMLATAPKSNSAHDAYFAAKADSEAGLGIEIPEHLRSPLFSGYKYPHAYQNNYVHQTYLPRDLIGKRYYEFGNNKTEQAAKAYYDFITSQTDKKK
jgi:putative ATPase